MHAVAPSVAQSVLAGILAPPAPAAATATELADPPSPVAPAADDPRPALTADLVRRSRDGDEDASRQLIQQLYPLVLRIVRAHRPRRLDEEDLAQMVFCRVFERLHQWRATAPLEHWVSRVAVNICLNQLARHRVRPETRWADLPPHQADELDRTLASASDAGLDTGIDAIAARDLVDQLLAAAPPRDRLVLQLLDVEGRSVEDVSRITGWSRTLVKVQAFRARHRMRRSLARLLREPGTPSPVRTLVPTRNHSHA